ncbi:MAG: prepilin-type N-terminal cleavage/methylation domain-containing protein, partial [Eubacteriales bacterium]|nr:prepilin-type N-terminal cleavage/methylation domain-containing protein [Eubacteriales bacterium]
MKKNNKKGFTIVELVIVIAVIAILAAVLIPTFSSVIKKAKVNNDIQLVR